MASAEQKINNILAFDDKIYESADLMQTIINKISVWGSDLPDKMKDSFYSEGIMRDMDNLLWTLEGLKVDLADARTVARWYIDDDTVLIESKPRARRGLLR